MVITVIYTGTMVGQGGYGYGSMDMERNELRVLFIYKRRIDSYGISFGLLNSAVFVANALRHNGVHAEVETAIDANCIDRLIHRHKPTHVVIEALWVTPEKIDELLWLHRKPQWIIRIHSKTPFLANEGIAIEWLRKYEHISRHHTHLHISANNEQFAREIGLFTQCVYLPNIYMPPAYEHENNCGCHKTLNIGCFGAVRPMKNHLMQAMAAIKFAESQGRPLQFHINAGRVEQKGEQVLKNLRALFRGHHHCKLVGHDWLPHEEFIKLVRKMDLGMQVSLTESFNIVTADFVDNDIPIVVSRDIDWMPRIYRANPNDMYDIVRRLGWAWFGTTIGLQRLCKTTLKRYNRKATDVWMHYLGLKRIP